MNYATRKCVECEIKRGYRAFSKGAEVCKSCVDWLMEKEWRTEGTVFEKPCYRCGEPKNIFTSFYRGPHERTRGSICNTCRINYQSDYHGHSRDIKCTKSFEFNGNKICDKCEEIKPVNDFNGRNSICKACSGVGLNKSKKNYKAYFSTDEEIFEREQRIAIKRTRKEQFVSRFNKEFMCQEVKSLETT